MRSGDDSLVEIASKREKVDDKGGMCSHIPAFFEEEQKNTMIHEWVVKGGKKE